MKKQREALGSPEWRENSLGRGCWHARISAPDGTRKRVRLQAHDGRSLDRKEQDELLAYELTAELSDKARSQRRTAYVTVQQWGERWTSGELFREHGEIRGLKLKASAKDDEQRLRAHAYPHIGQVLVADVTEIQIERCMAMAARLALVKRGKPWRSANKLQLYQVLRRLFDLAIKPGRLRKDNPVSVDLRPSKDSPKLYGFLYPAEFLMLMRCYAVPCSRRIYYALGVYTGLRKSSLGRMTWASIDFQNQVITSLQNKNGVPQMWAQTDPGLPGLASILPVLREWYGVLGKPKLSTPVVPDLECPARKEAETLRRDLQLAGVTRPTLFERNEHMEPLRFHDLRATFVTWARRAGKDSGWISDRTGHLTPSMLARYDRGARSLADLRMEPFPVLPLMR